MPIASAFVSLILCVSAYVPANVALTFGFQANKQGFDVAVIQKGESTARCAAMLVVSDTDFVSAQFLGYDETRRPFTAARASDLVNAWASQPNTEVK
jgi:hypothetical protein